MALTDGIIGCWSPLLRGSGYLLPDLARGNHGVLSNMNAGTDWPGATVRGVHGRVLDFDGVNDYVVTSRGVPVASAVLSVSLWVYRRDTPTTFPRLIDLSDGTHTVQAVFDMGASGGGRGFFTTKHSQYQAGITGTEWGFVPTLQTWEHIAIIFNGAASITRVWRNGVEQTGAPNNNIGAAAATNTLVFGVRRDLNAITQLDGQLGEIAIFNRALTAVEFAEIYRQGNGAIGRQLTGQARWRVYGAAPTFRPAWAVRRAQIICGGLQ